MTVTRTAGTRPSLSRAATTLFAAVVPDPLVLFPGATIEGPAVIEEAYTSVLLVDGWSCRRDKSGHLVARRQG